MKHRVPKVIAIWMYENEQARWFEFAPPHDDLPDDVTVTKMVPQRTWVGLTDEQIEIFREAHSKGRGAGWSFDFKGFARAIEAKLKEKNHG